MGDSTNINMATGVPRRVERLVSIFQSILKTKFNVGEYKHRLMMQKIAYILKGKDKTFNYHFNWFTRGPHSDQLKSEEEYYRDSEVRLNEADAQNVAFIKNLMGEVNDLNLELYSAIIYLMKEHGTYDPDEIYSIIHESKPWFNREDIESTFKKISEVAF
jgi:uncharacterized protein YwgA